MNANRPLVCHYCRYDANAANATHCEICHRPLKKSSFLISKPINRHISVSSILWLGLILLLLLAGEGYLFWKNQVMTSRTLSSLSSSRIQLYNSMRDVQNVPRGLFNYGGAHTFAALNSDSLIGAITQAHPAFHLRYTQPLNKKPGSSTGIAMLLNGELSIAQSARSLEDVEYNKARARGFTLEQVAVAIDGIAFYTHQNLLIPGLSVDQLQEIFRGQVTNWKQVGGPDLPIMPVAVSPKVTSAIKFLLGSQGEDVSRNVQIVSNYTEAVRKVASTPGGISYGSAPIVLDQRTIRFIGVAKAHSREYVQPFTNDGKVNAVAFRNDTYPLTRRVFVIIRRDGTLDERAGVAYINLLLSNEGQQLVEKAGFVSIR